MQGRWIRVVITIGTVLGGCGTGGHLVTPEQIAELEIGTTSQDEVRNTLEEPKEKVIFYQTGKEVREWIYSLTKYSSDPRTGLPPIGVTQVPISRAYRKTTDVAIIFDQHGVVTDIKEKLIRVAKQDLTYREPRHAGEL